jgi:hypothetical protein
MLQQPSAGKQPAVPPTMQQAFEGGAQEMQQLGLGGMLLLQSQQLCPPQPPGQGPVTSEGDREFCNGVAASVIFRGQ